MPEQNFDEVYDVYQLNKIVTNTKEFLADEKLYQSS